MNTATAKMANATKEQLNEHLVELQEALGRAESADVTEIVNESRTSVSACRESDND